MASINVKIPEPMKEQIDEYIQRHPYYLNKSELVRDAIRHLINNEPRLSKETLAVIERGKEEVENDEGITLEELREQLDD